ncbi:MAG: hypothetical protein HYU78_02295 [Rhodocyclales bacterium]|nr:hypothetical protein [Rhodocyclales bacterium]
MKVRQITDSRNQHLVAVEHNGELRCYFKDSSSHTASVAFETVKRDIARHGESVVGFAELPLIVSRTAKTGRTIYDVAE